MKLPKSPLEIVIRLCHGPDDKGRYDFTVYSLGLCQPGEKSRRKDGLVLRGQSFLADPYTQIAGRRGAQILIDDLTGNWKGRKTR